MIKTEPKQTWGYRKREGNKRKQPGSNNDQTQTKGDKDYLYKRGNAGENTQQQE